METAPTPRRIGRPPSFDRDTALHQAMLVFWQHGYETTSVADLTAAMGIAAPSLYAAFGDKKRLFLEAIHLYAGDPEVLEATLSAQPTAQAAARALLVASATAFTGATTPRGCLLASATASGSAAAADVQADVAALRGKVRAALCSRFERAVREEPPLAAVRPAALADLVIAVIQGMSVLARDGAPRANLLAMIDVALTAFPDGDPLSPD